MFLLRNKKDISIFRMKKAPYLLLCADVANSVLKVNKISLIMYDLLSSFILYKFIGSTQYDMSANTLHSGKNFQQTTF